MRATIAILGGAMTPASGPFQAAVEEAAREGMEILKKGETSVEAVIAAARCTEDNPVLNSGTGSRLNMVGEAEMDACVMEGKGLKSGAVACITKVRNPILVAEKVMRETDHILFVGEGAVKFARSMGFPEYDPVTFARRQEWEDIIGRLKRGEELPDSYRRILSYWKKMKNWIDEDTVGVVAIDKDGTLAVASSSGGGPLKMPGRVGDVPLIGCGIYADNRAGAVVFTGHGEVFCRHLAAKTVCDLMRQGMNAQEAAEEWVGILKNEAPGAVVSLVCIDRKGNVGGCRNVKETPHAMLQEGADACVSGFSKILFPVK
jgi:L-asparaginase / beta-aspartyl-peptidase